MNLPQRVMLRNKQFAVVQKRTKSHPFVYFGQTEDLRPQLWRADGCWRENGILHPLDIVGLVDEARNVSVFAPAAGAKPDLSP